MRRCSSEPGVILKKLSFAVFIFLFLVSLSFWNSAVADESAARDQAEATLKNLKADIKLERYLKKYGPALGIDAISLDVTINGFSRNFEFSGSNLLDMKRVLVMIGEGNFTGARDQTIDSMLGYFVPVYGQYMGVQSAFKTTVESLVENWSQDLYTTEAYSLARDILNDRAIGYTLYYPSVLLEEGDFKSFMAAQEDYFFSTWLEGRPGRIVPEDELAKYAALIRENTGKAGLSLRQVFDHFIEKIAKDQKDHFLTSFRLTSKRLAKKQAEQARNAMILAEKKAFEKLMKTIAGPEALRFDAELCDPSKGVQSSICLNFAFKGIPDVSYSVSIDLVKLEDNIESSPLQSRNLTYDGMKTIQDSHVFAPVDSPGDYQARIYVYSPFGHKDYRTIYLAVPDKSEALVEDDKSEAAMDAYYDTLLQEIEEEMKSTVLPQINLSMRNQEGNQISSPVSLNTNWLDLTADFRQKEVVEEPVFFEISVSKPDGSVYISDTRTFSQGTYSGKYLLYNNFYQGRMPGGMYKIRITMSYENAPSQKKETNLSFVLHPGELRDGETVFEAIQRGDAKKAEKLLRAGADPGSKKGGYSVHMAVQKGQLNVVSALMQAGADPDLKDKNSITPLMAASQAGLSEIAQVLIQNGADINGQGYKDLTPLHFALLNNQPEMAHFLIGKGANVHIRNQKGETPGYYAYWLMKDPELAVKAGYSQAKALEDAKRRKDDSAEFLKAMAQGMQMAVVEYNKAATLPARQSQNLKSTQRNNQSSTNMIPKTTIAKSFPNKDPLAKMYYIEIFCPHPSYVARGPGVSLGSFKAADRRTNKYALALPFSGELHKDSTSSTGGGKMLSIQDTSANRKKITGIFRKRDDYKQKNAVFLSKRPQIKPFSFDFFIKVTKADKSLY